MKRHAYVMLVFALAGVGEGRAQTPPRPIPVPNLTPIKDVSASSTKDRRSPWNLLDDDVTSYRAATLVDADHTEAWCEDADGIGIGQKATIVFGRPTVVGKVVIATAQLKQGGVPTRVTQLELTTSDGQKVKTTESSPRVLTATLAGKPITSLTLTIAKAEQGVANTTACLYDVTFPVDATRTLRPLFQVPAAGADSLESVANEINGAFRTCNVEVFQRHLRFPFYDDKKRYSSPEELGQACTNGDGPRPITADEVIAYPEAMQRVKLDVTKPAPQQLKHWYWFVEWDDVAGKWFMYATDDVIRR